MKKKFIFLISFIILLIGYYFLHEWFNFNIFCPIHKLSGFYCPGCGITRMFFAILRLDFYQAFRYNPLVFILLILYLFKIIMELIIKHPITISNRSTYILLFIVIAYGILRNVPLFKFLAPTIIK